MFLLYTHAHKYMHFLFFAASTIFGSQINWTGTAASLSLSSQCHQPPHPSLKPPKCLEHTSFSKRSATVLNK